MLGVLLAALLLPIHSAPAVPSQMAVTARVTHYVESGYTYGGPYTTLGETAGCSWDIPLFSTVVMPDGHVFICEDRGVDDGVERVDLYDPYFIFQYNDWEVVEIYPPYYYDVSSGYHIGSSPGWDASTRQYGEN